MNQTHIICSSDLFPGLYERVGDALVFHPELLSQSHLWCKKQFRNACESMMPGTKVFVMRGLPGSGKSTYIETLKLGSNAAIFVDNTNLSIAEMTFYVEAAPVYDHHAEIITIECPIEVAMARNTHGVPADRFPIMKARMDEGTKAMQPWWKHRVIKYSEAKAA